MSAIDFLGAPAGLQVPSDYRDLFARYETPWGEFLGASAREGWWATVAGQGEAGGRINRAEITAPADDLAPLAEPDWRASPEFRQGIPFRPGMTRAEARTRAEIFDETAERHRLMAGRTGLMATVAGFGAGVVGSLPTPENFIPFAGPALRVAQAQRVSARLAAIAARAEAATAGGILARAGVGAAMGATDGLLGSAIAMPFTVPSRESFGDDVTWTDIVLDLAMGAAAGGVLGGAFGAAFGRNRARDARAGTQDAAGAPERAAPGDPTIPEQDAALRALAASAVQVADGGEVDLSLLPPQVRDMVSGLRAENRRLAAQVLPTAGEGASVSERAAARAGGPTQPAAPDGTGRAVTPAGTEIEFRWEVVEADDLVPSHTLPDFAENSRFPQELQPRDRGSEERQAQVLDIAARLRPEEVEASPLTTTGAPIVGPDGLVESGNGRTLAILAAYRRQLATAQAYRAMLVRAGFAAAEMREPVLIRRRTTEMDAAGRRRLAEESNARQTDALTPAEQARTDARGLGAEQLRLLRGQDLASAENGDFVRAFLGRLPGTEARDFSADGALTPDGEARLRRALAARAYQDPTLIARLTQSRDGAAEALGRALLDVAPALARLRTAAEAGEVRPALLAIDALVRAVQRIQAARDAGRPLRSVFDQLDLFGDDASPAERAFLDLLLRHPVRQDIGGLGRETIAARLAAYARAALEAPQQPDAFGLPPPHLGDVLRAAFREAGLDAPPALRALEADAFRPPSEEAPPPPLPEAPSGDPVARAAADLGMDADATIAAAEFDRLAEAGGLPPELVADLRDADDLVAKTEKAEAVWAEAAACAVRG